MNRIYLLCLISILAACSDSSQSSSALSIKAAAIQDGKIRLEGTSLNKISGASIVVSGIRIPLALGERTTTKLALEATQGLKLAVQTVYPLTVNTVAASTNFTITVEPTGKLTCPSHMTLVGQPGTSSAFCIDTVSRPAQTFSVATDVCFGAGYRLCSFQEWHNACTTVPSLSLQNSTDSVSDISFSSGTFPNVQAGGTNCDSRSIQTLGNASGFRCCAD
jgi:hypothetical protein